MIFLLFEKSSCVVEPVPQTEPRGHVKKDFKQHFSTHVPAEAMVVWTELAKCFADPLLSQNDLELALASFGLSLTGF